MKKFIIGLLLLVSGCAFQTLNDGLPYLVGKPIDSAVNVLGLPSREMMVGDYTIYEWSNQYSTTIPITTQNTTYTSGNVGTSPVNMSSTSYNTNYKTVNNVCSIKLSVNSLNIIQRWEWRGNQGACQYYANGVKRLIP